MKKWFLLTLMKYTRHYESQDEPTSLAVQDVQPEYKEHHGHKIQHRLNTTYMARSKSSNFVKYREVDSEPGLHGRTFCQFSATAMFLKYRKKLS